MAAKSDAGDLYLDTSKSQPRRWQAITMVLLQALRKYAPATLTGTMLVVNREGRYRSMVPEAPVRHWAVLKAIHNSVCIFRRK